MITGGGSGIGYAIAKLLSEKGNKVILTGRNASKIEKAANALGVNYIVCDITNNEAVNNLIKKINADYSDLSMLINNAGVGYLYKLAEDVSAYDKSKEEFETNYFAPVKLTEALLPLLKKQPEAAIVNITSNVTFHPLVLLPTYSDSKAALHSHSVALRLSLAKGTHVKVFEVMPSLVNTDATKDMGGEQHGMPPQVVAENLLNGLAENRYEIYVGETGKQREAYFANPVAAAENFNRGLL